MVPKPDLAARDADILVVDDEITSLRLLTELLIGAGYQARPAERPLLALEAALAQPPGLILLDVRMPEMSGFEVCRRLKQDERTRDIPVIFVSALTEVEDQIQGFEVGGVDFISKPFQELEILARVKTHLQLRTMQLHLEKLVAERTANLAQANEALRDSEEKYRTLVEQAQDGIVVLQDSKIQFTNPAAGKLFGYTSKELLNTVFTKYIAPDELVKTTDIYTRRLRGESVPSRYESAIRHKDGSRVEVEFNAGLTLYSGEPADLIMVRDITERKQAEQQIMEYQQRLQSLASQLTLSEERERRRIARELHDEVGQTLAFARMRLASALKTASDAQREAILDDVSQSLRQAIGDTRDLVFDLSSPLMHELGLAAALAEWLEEQVGKKHGIQTEFIHDGQRLPPEEDMRAMLFRSTRELLTNVVKHSQAKRVTVRLEGERTLVRIVVEDDGVGFDVDAASEVMEREGGFGLFSIQERMADLGGSLEIMSEPGQGCTAILTAPATIRQARE